MSAPNISVLLAAIRSSLDQIDRQVADGGLSAPSLAAALVELRQIRRETTVVHSAVECRLVDALRGQWEAVLDGVGAVRVRGGKKRTKWDHDSLWPLVAANAGAAPSPADVVAAARSAVAPAYWRAGTLKGWGIQPDEYCEVGWGPKTVEFAA